MCQVKFLTILATSCTKHKVAAQPSVKRIISMVSVARANYWNATVIYANSIMSRYYVQRIPHSPDVRFVAAVLVERERTNRNITNGGASWLGHA